MSPIRGQARISIDGNPVVFRPRLTFGLLRATIALVLLLLIVVFWVKSFRHVVIVGFFTPAAHLQGLASDRRGLVLFFSDAQFGSERSLSVDAMTAASSELDEMRAYLLDDPTTVKWKFAGFRVSAGIIGTPNGRFELLLVPYWFVVGVCLASAAGPVRRRLVRWHRSRNNRCPECGYDLRASVDRCPECGLVTRIGPKPE